MKISKVIIAILRTYGLVLAIFSLFRLALFVADFERVDTSAPEITDILTAFLMGIRFDFVISSYLLILPAFVLLVADIFGFKSKKITTFFFYWVFILFAISFLIAAADIPYFIQFFARISIAAFEWFDSLGFVAKMIFQEPRYFGVLIPLIFILVIFYKLLKRIFNSIKLSTQTNLYLKVFTSLLFLFIMFLGIRGRVQLKSPIRVGTAYFSNDAFLNQLGLNPVFTLLKSYLESKKSQNKTIQLMDDQQAIKNTRNYLNINDSLGKSPIARSVSPDSLNPNKPNVVLIIMESMSAAKMTRHGNTQNLTPFLDSISYESLYFDHIYTAGIHTFNGIFGTLFSFPALYHQHPLKSIKQYNGIGRTLRSLGYSTTFFTTHDGQFDNVEGFLYANDFETVVSQSNYPADEVKSTLGVPDDYMFDFSLPIIDNLHAEGKPFFVSFMTASDHGPFYIPDYFKPKNEHIKQQIVEYADWSLGKFIDSASQKSWFDNTIFVFVADHGAPLTAVYDISLDYHHTPLIFYAPKLIDSTTTNSSIGGQIDVFPTIMGTLDLPYVNNTFGIDLLNEQRPYIFINGDDKIGVLDHDFLWIEKEGVESKLVKYKIKDKTNYISQYPEKAQKMEQYAKSQMQVFQYMLLNETILLNKEK